MAAPVELRAMVPSASLSVFQPLDAFEREEQLHWERYLLDRCRPRRRSVRATPTVDGCRFARRCSRRPRAEHAEVPCGGRTHVREPVAHASARSGRDLSVPRARAAGAVGRLRPEEGRHAGPQGPEPLPSARPLRRAFCHMSPWHVPVRWFVLFQRRGTSLERPTSSGGPMCTTAPRHPAGHAARRAGGPGLCAGPTSARSASSSSTCTNGSRRSIRGHCWSSTTVVCGVMSVGRVDEDHSARDVHEALEALEAGSTRAPPTSTRACFALGRGGQPRSDELIVVVA